MMIGKEKYWLIQGREVLSSSADIKNYYSIHPINNIICYWRFFITMISYYKFNFPKISFIIISTPDYSRKNISWENEGWFVRNENGDIFAGNFEELLGYLVSLGLEVKMIKKPLKLAWEPFKSL